MGIVKVTAEGKEDWQWVCRMCGAFDVGFITVGLANEYGSEHALTHMREVLRENRAMADMLTYIALHVGKYQWKVLTTEQKELWADLIDADRAVQDEHDNYVGTDMAYQPVERWWRD